MKKWNLIIASISIIIGMIFIYLSNDFPASADGSPGPGLWPKMLAVVLIAVALLLVAVSLLSKSEAVREKVNLLTDGTKRVYCLMGIVVGFLIVMYFLGFFVGVLFFIPAVMYLLNVRNIKNMTITSILVTVSIYIIFVLILNIPLPKPIFLR